MKRKIKDIRFHYGQAAVEYFEKNCSCEHCGEERLIVLNVHHTHGRKVESFKILCFNCHMLEHNKKEAHKTFDSCIKEHEKQRDLHSRKDQYILQLLNEGFAMHMVMKKSHCAIERVRRIMKQNGFISSPRNKCRKAVTE